MANRPQTPPGLPTSAPAPTKLGPGSAPAPSDNATFPAPGRAPDIAPPTSPASGPTPYIVPPAHPCIACIVTPVVVCAVLFTIFSVVGLYFYKKRKNRCGARGPIRQTYFRKVINYGRTANAFPREPALRIRHLGGGGSEGAVALREFLDQVDGRECRVFTENEPWFDKFHLAAHAHGLDRSPNLVFHKKFTSDTAGSVVSIEEHGEAFFVLLIGSGSGSTSFFDPTLHKTNSRVLEKLTNDGRSFCIVVYPYGGAADIWRKSGRGMIGTWPKETQDKTYLLI